MTSEYQLLNDCTGPLEMYMYTHDISRQAALSPVETVANLMFICMTVTHVYAVHCVKAVTR